MVSLFLFFKNKLKMRGILLFSQPGLSESVRREIGEAAVRAAKAVGYVGAGRVGCKSQYRLFIYHEESLNNFCFPFFRFFIP